MNSRKSSSRKKFSAAGGLTITNEIRVLVAGQDCLIAMVQPFDYYPNVGEIDVYPSTVVVPGSGETVDYR